VSRRVVRETTRLRVSHLQWGSVAVLVASTALALLALAWMGYDLRLLPVALIGDGPPAVDDGGHHEAVYGSWMLYQALDNLLERPLDPGYSTMFYGDPASFAYSSTHYGIALVALPVYLISGKNLVLTFNLYLIATFPLSAWAVYLLCRHVLRAAAGACVVAGLMVAFSQFRLVHIWHIELLSTQFYVLGLYGLHRLIDAPRLRRAAGLGAVCALTVLASGYLGAALAITGGIVLVYALARRVITRRHILPLVLTGVLAVMLCLPLIVFRYENATFAAGRRYVEVVGMAARPVDWLRGGSALYGGYVPVPNTLERVLWVGALPLSLAALAWPLSQRREFEQADGPRRALGRRDVVLLYSLVIVAGYVLTLGPELAVGGGAALPMPYRLLMHLPGFRGMRVPGRLIILVVTGTAVLSAVTLGAVLERFRRPVNWAGFSAAAVLLAIELMPYDGVTANPYARGVEPGGSAKLLEPVVREHDTPITAWLAAQPPGTPVFHTPSGYTLTADYLVDIPYHEQPMLNGVGGFVPEWYRPVFLEDFPGVPFFVIMHERGIAYILVHHDLMSPPEEAAFARRWESHEALWGTLPHVGRFGEVDVYEVRIATPRRVTVDFDHVAPGRGWCNPEETPGGVSLAWTKETQATLDLFLVAETDVRVAFRVVQGATPGILDSLWLAVDDEPVVLSRRADEAGAVIFEGLIPRAAAARHSPMIRLVFGTDQIARAPVGGSGGARRLGVAFDWVRIEPVEGGE
jgi:hypothetical protein